MQRSILAIAALTSLATAQFTVVIPNGNTSSEGNSNNAFPWGRGTAGSLEIQTIYDSTNFTLQGINYPILISGLRYRANGGATSAGGTYGACTIDMATATVDQATPSTTFAANMAADLTQVYAGPVTVLPTAAATPGIWAVDVPFSSNFLYDPTSGNDLVIFSHMPPPATSPITGNPLLQFDAQAAGSLSSRVYNSSTAVYPNATGIVNTNIGMVVEVTYVPAQGLYAGFAANVTGGISPLTVNFSDNSFSSDPAGVLGWAWDFDGDSVIDSTLQNPTFVYTNCGSYDVTLTVVDASHTPSTLTRTAYINTDVIHADFTTQLLAPLTVLFADNSNLPASSWAWDLDGDSVIDSTSSTAAWAYPNSNPVNVTLTVTRLCAPPSTVTRLFVPLPHFSTNIAANNNGASGWTVYFDLDVLNPLGLNLSSFDSISTTTNSPFSVDVYLKDAGYSGFEYNPAPWTLVGTASGVANAVANEPSNSQFPTPVHIPAGSYGVALRYNGLVPRYVTQTAPVTTGNGDLSLTLGSAAATTVGPFAGTTTTVNQPRGWSGVLYYSTHNFDGGAGHGFFAQGCAGSMGISQLTANHAPRLGTTMTLTVDNLPVSAAIVLTGFSNTASVFGPLPVNLTPYGAPGCFGNVSTDASLYLGGAANTASWNFQIPNDPAFSGLLLYHQALVLDPAANALGAVTSNATGMVIGY